MPVKNVTSTILDNLNVAVLLFDHDLHLRYVNPAAQVLFQTSERKLLGQHSEQLLPEDAVFHDILYRARRSGQPFTEREVPLTFAGRQRHVTVHCTVTPINEPHRGDELLVELQPLDHHLRISREEALIAQHETTRTIVRGLAHEIKNPLGGLRGAAQLLARELHEEHLKEYTRIIINEADRLQNLMDRLLGPSAIPKYRSTNIHEITERVRTIVAVEVSPAISLQRDYDPSIPVIKADPDQLIQALLNIVRNAVQALNGAGTIVLRTRTRRQLTINGQRHRLVAAIDVQDNGPGIDPGIVNKIFYPMVTGRAEGTGLGLSIAQAIVNRHGGLITCQSRPGNTVFSIFIPLEHSSNG